MKLLFDDTMKSLSSNAYAWQNLNYAIAHDAAVVKHIANLNAVTSGQTGQTANEQTVSPERTGAGDALAAAAYPANRTIDTATASVATAAAGVATANQSVADAVANLMNAITAAVTQSAGKASQSAGS